MQIGGSAIIYQSEKFTFAGTSIQSSLSGHFCQVDSRLAQVPDSMSEQDLILTTLSPHHEDAPRLALRFFAGLVSTLRGIIT